MPHWGAILEGMGSLMDVVVKDPAVMGGEPVFRGTRVPVQSLIDHLASGGSINRFLDDFPTVSREAAVAVLRLAGEYIRGQGGHL